MEIMWVVLAVGVWAGFSFYSRSRLQKYGSPVFTVSVRADPRAIREAVERGLKGVNKLAMVDSTGSSASRTFENKYGRGVALVQWQAGNAGQIVRAEVDAVRYSSLLGPVSFAMPKRAFKAINRALKRLNELDPSMSDVDAP